MSRSGTLRDALRFVDEFQRASVQAPRERESAAAHGDGEHVTKPPERRRAGRREDREKAAEKDARRKSKRSKDRHRRRRRGERNAVTSSDDDEDEHDDEESDEDDDDRHRHRREKEKRRAAERKKERRESRKKERKSASSRKKAERKAAKDGSRKREEERKQQRSGRLRSPEDDASQSEGKNSDSGSESSESEGGDSALRAETVASGIVHEFPEVKNDLHQLLQTMDSGQAVDISELPNKRLVVLLQELFQSLHLKKSAGGAYLLPSGARPILGRLSWSSISGNRPKAGESSQSREHDSEPPTPPPSVEKQDSDANHKPHSKPEAVSGPLPRPQENADTQKRRVIGPAMPSAEMLEAAAKLTDAEEALREAETALENDPLIGPPPPTAVAEAASANDAERFEEVTRITASDVGDAYELLGLKQGVSAGDLKKRYWKLSLLVHPDKCQHPLAHQAFMALNKAFKDLQDPLKRSDIDRKANDKLAKEEYEADMRAQLQAAQWRKLRGEEALPGDAELLRGDVKDPERDEWMTKLPPERQAGGPPSQQNTFFSRTEKSGRGDTSAWTDTPLEKAQRAKMQYLEAYSQAALTGPESTESLFEKEKAVKTAAVLDEYNQKKRSLSLLEEHQQKSRKGLKKGKREKNQPEDEKKNEWAEAHPWKPWDREKDLTAGRQAIKWDDKKSAGESLSSRFGTSGQRTFL